jgi:hypothetical protein
MESVQRAYFLHTLALLITSLAYPSHQAHCYQVNAIERRMQKFATSISEKLQCNLATHVAVASQVNM